MDPNRSLVREWKNAKSAAERTEIDNEMGQEMVEIVKMLDASVHPDDMPVVLATLEQYSLMKRAQMTLQDKALIKLLKLRHVIQTVTVRIPFIRRDGDEQDGT